MKNEYRFTSDEEPTDEQLHQLMQEVAIDVKKRAEKADKQFAEQLQRLSQNINNKVVTLKTATK